MKSKEVNKNFIADLSGFCEKHIPSSFSIVLLVTIITVIMALFLTDSTPVSLAQNWYDGFWSMITFSFQICMLMFTGFLVGDSKPVRRIMVRIAKLPKTTTGAVLFYWLIVGFLGYLHFAISMAAAILLGRALIVEQNKKGNRLPYNFLVALGFGALILQAGPSAGSPLMMASKGNFMEDIIGVIPLTDSMLTLPMIVMNLCIYIAVAVLIVFITPKIKGDDYDEFLLRLERELAQEDKKPDIKAPRTLAFVMDNTKIFQRLTGIVGLIIFIIKISSDFSAEFNFNSINFLFLMLALVFHGTPESILGSARRAVSNLSGIIFQYPFYAGIFGILNSSGLGAVLTQSFVAVSSKRTFTFLILIFTALLNFLVPSGGSQFMVEAPYIMPAAIQIGVSPNLVLNAFTCDDLLTNLVQPFWSLPFIAAFGVKYKDVFPYSVIIFVISGIIMSLFFILWMY